MREALAKTSAKHKPPAYLFEMLIIVARNVLKYAAAKVQFFPGGFCIPYRSVFTLYFLDLLLRQEVEMF